MLNIVLGNKGKNKIQWKQKKIFVCLSSILLLLWTYSA